MSSSPPDISDLQLSSNVTGINSLGNAYTLEEDEQLQKRVFIINPNGNPPRSMRKASYTVGEIQSYLFNNVGAGAAWDDQYGNLIGFFGKTSSVS